jgi:hypothetical protein
VVIDVMTYTATASEPSSWIGTLNAAFFQVLTIASAYRGVAGLAIDGNSSVGTATSFNTATVNNPASTNWRVVAAAYASATTSYQISSSEVINRRRATLNTIEVGLWDSNGTVGSGNTSRQVSRGAVWECAAAWIGLLDNQDGVVATGTLSASMPIPSMTASGTLSYNATMSVTLPSMPSMTAAGIATPPDGVLGVLVLPVVTMAAATAAKGTLDVVAGPTVNIVAETRTFGIRVVTPEAESRVITPILGADD